MKKILFLLLLSCTLSPISQEPEESTLIITLIDLQENLMRSSMLKVFPEQHGNIFHLLDQIELNLRDVTIHALNLLALTVKAHRHLKNIKVSRNDEVSS